MRIAVSAENAQAREVLARCCAAAPSDIWIYFSYMSISGLFTSRTPRDFHLGNSNAF